MSDNRTPTEILDSMEANARGISMSLDALKRSARSNRWRAFTNDELVMLKVGPYQITAHGAHTTDAATLLDEIKAELERRRGESPAA